MNRFGPLLDANGVTFRLWAPAAREVALLTDRTDAMQKRGARPIRTRFRYGFPTRVNLATEH